MRMDPSGHVPIPIRGSMLVYHEGAFALSEELDAQRNLHQSFKYIAIYRDSMEAVVQKPITRDAPVHLEGLGKEYGHFTALKALDLTVAEGTSLGFLGPNGAGKSTTIKIMTNLIRPSRG